MYCTNVSVLATIYFHIVYGTFDEENRYPQEIIISFMRGFCCLKRPAGGEWELGDDPSFPPRGPFTCLADLEGPTATGGGVYRAKAVVSDTMGCKLRKKKYLVSEKERGRRLLAFLLLRRRVSRRKCNRTLCRLCWWR